MIKIDEKKIFYEIERRKPKTIIINSPSGLIAKIQKLLLKIQKLFNVQIITISDSCYGICDTVNREASKLKADIAFHIGHNIAPTKIGNKTILIDIEDDIKFDEVLEVALNTLKNYNKIGLCTISQHLHQLKKAQKFFQQKQIDTIIGEKNGFLKDGQVLGCDFSTAFKIRDDVDAFAFLGQSEFHSIGIALATRKPTFMLDPYYNQIFDVTKIALNILKKSLFAIYKSVDANNIGVIIGLKEGQMNLEKANMIKDKLEMHGKRVFLFALHEISNDRLLELNDIEVFIQTACPRISIDGDKFNRPVLAIPQAEALLKILEGKTCENFLEKDKWK